MSKFTFEIFQNENFVDLSLYQFGYEECDPLHSFGPAVRNHFLFHYIFSGKGRLMSTDDKGKVNEYCLTANQGFLIWPSQCNFYSADEKFPWTYGWVEFDGLKARELAIRAGLTFNSPVYTSNNIEEREKMKNELAFITVNKRNNTPLALIGHLYLFLNSLVISSSSSEKAMSNSIRNFYIREALSFIEQHYHEEIGIENIASVCNIDRSYLGKLFKNILNSTPHEFLINYRMNKACELMKITDHTIGEISNLVGYSNQLNFSRAFKKTVGKSPKEWRNEHKHSHSMKSKNT